MQNCANEKTSYVAYSNGSFENGISCHQILSSIHESKDRITLNEGLLHVVKIAAQVVPWTILSTILTQMKVFLPSMNLSNPKSIVAIPYHQRTYIDEGTK